MQSCQLWPVWLFHAFPHYLTIDTIFGGGILKNKTCSLIFSTIFVRNIIINVDMSLCKVPATLVKCLLKLNFLDIFET